MKSEHLEEGLKKLDNTLSGIFWLLSGRSALIAHGMPYEEFADIDTIVNPEQENSLVALLKDKNIGYEVVPAIGGLSKKYQFVIGGFSYDVVLDNRVHPAMGETVLLGDRRVRVPYIGGLMQMYRFIGRSERVEEIQSFMTNSQ